MGKTLIAGGRPGMRDPNSRVPYGYTELEYIQSSGTQYIDLGISVPHANARIVVDFTFLAIGTDTPITGHANTTWGWTTNMVFTDASGTMVLNGVNTGIVLVAGTRYNVEYTSTSYSLNGGSAVSATRSFTDGYNDTLFYSSGKYGMCRIYAYKLYNGTTLVRDMIPCINPDGEIGMYDAVNKNFYGNAGTGTFAGMEAA